MSHLLLAKPVAPLLYFDLEAPDVGLGYLATALKRAGHSVRIVDSLQRGLDQDGLLAAIARERPDAVGFKVYTKDLASVRESMRRIRALWPAMVTLAGGPFPSGAGADTLRYLPDCDYAFQGEAEEGLPMLAEALSRRDGAPGPAELAKIPGLIWRGPAATVANGRSLPEDLDALGYPDWEALQVRDYMDDRSPALVMRGNYLPVITGRGCPYRCTYCAGPLVTGQATRRHSLEYVLGWLEFFRDRYGARHFSITDDNFLQDRSFVVAFCRALLDRKLEVRWECGSNGIRLNQVDEELLRLMERSGCYLVSVGVESGSPRILAAMRRHLDLDEIRRTTALIRRVTRFRIIGFFILGYPEETLEEIHETVRLALELPLDRANLFIYTPHPGTEAFEKYVDPLIFETGKSEDFRYDSVSGVHPTIPSWRLRLIRTVALLRFHMRPRIVLSMLGELDSLAKLTRVVEFFRFAFFHLPRFRPRNASRGRLPEGG